MHVVVLGAGYAGLTLTRRLESRLPPGADLTLVNDGPNHVLVHEIHRAIRRPAVADAISIPIADLLDRATFVDGRVVDVDAEGGTAELDPSEPDSGESDSGESDSAESISWEYGALCLGSETAYHGIEGLREHATPLKSLADAATIREGFLRLVDDGGRAVVGGAGLSGVQVAGELAALADEEGVSVPGDVEVVLLEQFGEVAPGFPDSFRRAVREELEARDVDVRTDTTVDRVSADAVGTDEGDLRYDEFVWTGGIAGSPAVGGDRPTVRADLRLTDRTFALGDAARIVDADGEPVPASAAAAVREAETAAENLGRLVEYDLAAPSDGFPPRLSRYRFDVPGWLVSVGDGAVAQIGPTVLRGAAARATKASVGAGYLTSIGAVRNAAALAEGALG